MQAQHGGIPLNRDPTESQYRMAPQVPHNYAFEAQYQIGGLELWVLSIPGHRIPIWILNGEPGTGNLGARVLELWNGKWEAGTWK